MYLYVWRPSVRRTVKCANAWARGRNGGREAGQRPWPVPHSGKYSVPSEPNRWPDSHRPLWWVSSQLGVGVLGRTASIPADNLYIDLEDRLYKFLATRRSKSIFSFSYKLCAIQTTLHSFTCWHAKPLPATKVILAEEKVYQYPYLDLSVFLRVKWDTTSLYKHYSLVQMPLITQFVMSGHTDRFSPI